MADKTDDLGKPGTGTTTPPETLEAALALLAERDAALATLTGDRDTWKGHARTWEERAKASDGKIKEYEEAAKSGQSDAEKAEARLKALEEQVTGYRQRDERSTWVSEISEASKFKDRGIDPSLLRGSTRDELEEHAKALLKAFPEKTPGAPADDAGGDGQQISEGEMSAADVVKAATGK